MRKNKRLVSALSAFAALSLIAGACGGDDEGSDDTTAPAATEAPEGTEAPAATDAPAGTDAPTTDGLKVGLAFDTGGRGDGTFNDSAAAGADMAETELGATVQELEALSDEDRKPNLEALTADGNNPIIAVGFLFSDNLLEIATANPDVTYAIVDGFVDPAAAPNVRNLGFAEHEGSFLVGAAAALKSETGKIGFIGGQEIDLIKKFEAGYTAGAQYINPDIEVQVQYLGAAGDNAAWGSPDKAKEIANGWYADGTDVIYTAAGGSGNGTIEAAIESDKWAIGVDSDQYYTVAIEGAQDHILTSMLKRVDTAVFETVKAASEGDFAGGIFAYDLAVDGVGYSTSGGHIDDIKDQLEELKAQIIAGEIEVPTAPAG